MGVSSAPCGGLLAASPMAMTAALAARTTFFATSAAKSTCATHVVHGLSSAPSGRCTVWEWAMCGPAVDEVARRVAHGGHEVARGIDEALSSVDHGVHHLVEDAQEQYRNRQQQSVETGTDSNSQWKAVGNRQQQARPPPRQTCRRCESRYLRR